MWFKNLVLFGVLFGATVIGSKAQVPVTVTFDPPSPAVIGVTTFRCEFTLPNGSALAQQYWEIINGGRIFEYTPSSGPDITPGYEEKIIGFGTDNTTFVEIYFDMTACDVGQYKCFIFATDMSEGEDTESLEVGNIIAPVLRYGEEIIFEDKTIIYANNETVSCSLENAGPPLPGLLELYISYDSNQATDQGIESPETCTWSYPALEFSVDGGLLPDLATLRCSVDYTGSARVLSPGLTLNSTMYKRPLLH